MKRKSDESKKNINNSKGMATCGNLSLMATEAYHFNQMNGNLSTQKKTHEVPETIVFQNQGTSSIFTVTEIFS